MSFHNHGNSRPCARCGCLKSNHTYWSKKRGTYSHPCRMHGCPEYVPASDSLSVLLLISVPQGWPHDQ